MMLLPDGADPAVNAVRRARIQRPADRMAPPSAPNVHATPASPGGGMEFFAGVQPVHAQAAQPHVAHAPSGGLMSSLLNRFRAAGAGGQAAPRPATPHPANPPGSAPGAGINVSYADTSGFGPGQDLRSAQIAPNFTPRYEGEAAGLVRGARIAGADPLAATDLSGARGALTRASQEVDGAGYDIADFAASGDAGRARALTMDALERAQSGPDRGQIAAERFRLLEEEANPGYERAARQVAQKAAAMGRRGAGMVNSDLADVATAREDMLTRAKRGLAADAAGAEVSDRAARAQLAAGVAGQLRGEDLTAAGFNADNAGRRANLALSRAASLSSLAGQEGDFARISRADGESDRAYTTDLQRTNAGLDFQRAGMLGEMDNTDFARGASMRGELRGEREWQEGAAQRSYENRLRAYSLASGQQMDQLRMLLGAANQGGDPTGELLEAAGQTGGDNGSAALMAEWSRRRAGKSSAAAVPSRPAPAGVRKAAPVASGGKKAPPPKVRR